MRQVFVLNSFIVHLACCAMMSRCVFAQQNHFVYIQADNQQPFYVKYDGKNYSSTSIGYLILPKLTNGILPYRLVFHEICIPNKPSTFRWMEKTMVMH